MPDRSKIKNIVFDLGVVLFNLEYELTVEAFKTLGVDNHEELFSDTGQLMLFDRFERGEIKVPEFLEGMQRLIPGEATDQSIIDAWNAMLLDLPQSSIDLLEALRPHYQLYLLSNTNDLHFARFHEIIKEQHGLDGLDQYFVGLYYSHNEGLRKPEPAFYRRLLEQDGLNPTETVFIDDMNRNVQSAEDVGIRGILLGRGMMVTDLFDEELKLLC
jgi:putative hydrolase of the HAD superfamily